MISDEAAFTEAQHTRDQAGLGLIAGRVTASLSGAATPRNSAATLRNTVGRPVFGAQSTVMASKPGIVVSATVTLAVLFAALGMALIATGHLSRLSILISATAVVYLAVALSARRYRERSRAAGPAGSSSSPARRRRSAPGSMPPPTPRRTSAGSTSRRGSTWRRLRSAFSACP
ncbi:hypothetical protein FLW53_29770 [Microbispora sp. SCL1-1]|uniref:hypothetical protein n=1 Tax=unclassified Microbispora TaxID=2614687 RepID=UPI00115AEF86|nr:MULTISPECIES: hypothetical protein [unclassified Microbispora]NJP28310.1 hypothetical protein [Microbispora sp. CL1-1]TQS09144.1 hypothetical protein FLW53_29770 [Microbispora sp. SCL1-1]